MKTLTFDRDERQRDPALGRLAALPGDIEPARDLWPEIAARLDRAEQVAPSRGPGLPWTWAIAAGVGVAAVSALLTYTLVDTPAQLAPQGAGPDSGGAVMTVADDRYARLGPEYLQTRAELLAAFNARVSALPAATRARVQSDLATIQGAAASIDEALMADPSSRLLNRLLLSTYQDELRLYASVAAAPAVSDERT